MPAQVTSLRSISAVGGTLVTMTCEARGTPPLAFSWTFNGTKWRGGIDNSLTHSNSITVGEASASTEGEYGCMANNTFGSDRKTATLFIIRESLSTAYSTVIQFLCVCILYDVSMVFMVCTADISILCPTISSTITCLVHVSLDYKQSVGRIDTVLCCQLEG